MTDETMPELPLNEAGPPQTTEPPVPVEPHPTAVSVPPSKPKAELVTGGSVVPIIPRNVDEVLRIAHAVVIAGLAPESFSKGSRDDKQTASKIMIAIMKGAEIGLAPLTALANIAIINGRACLWGDGAVALVQRSGKVSNWVETYEGAGDELVAVCSIFRTGQSTAYTGRFGMADAKRARLLTKGPWIDYPTRMLMWRARSYAMRTGFADCLSGLSIAEEAQDLPAVPEVVNTSFLEDGPGPLPVPE